MQVSKPRSDSLDQTREAAEIFRLGRRIGMSAGTERSFKIASGRVDSRRFLISLAPRPDFRGALGSGLAALNFPAALNGALEQGLKQSRFLHLGYEEPHGKPVCKLYCEAPPSAGARVRMHTAFKWRPDDAEDFTCDDYWRVNGLDEGTLRARIAGILEPNKDLAAIVERLADRALARIAVDELFFLEVTRDGVRRSFDLRLYDAGLVLSDAADMAEAAAELFGTCRVDALVAEHGQESLGHISASPSFLTFYHGAGELA